MEKRLIKIEELNAGERIDVVLAELFLDLTRSRIQNLILEGRVSVQGSLIKSKSYKVKADDEISLQVDAPVLLEAKAEDIPLKILYEDDSLLVVDKERGMVVHPGPGNYTGTIVNGLLYHCQGKLSSINGIIRPGIVHRLDKDTGGVMVVAKDDESHKSLAGQFEQRTVTRLYKAIVHNNFTEDEGTVNQAIGRDPNNRLRMKVDLKKGREAITHYKVIERFGRLTYIEAGLETGRTHQIRVHMAYIKHPIIGDRLYGPKNDPYQKQGQYLHAVTLGFIHPKSGEKVEFHSPLPEDFESLIEKFRRK